MVHDLVWQDCSDAAWWSLERLEIDSVVVRESVQEILVKWLGGEVETQGSAKPRCGGSIPPRASDFDIIITLRHVIKKFCLGVSSSAVERFPDKKEVDGPTPS